MPSDGKHPNQIASYFPPGKSAHPGGKPVGTRNRLTARFLNALADDFDKYGKEVIERCREETPAVYVKVIAALCPKEVEIKRPLQEMEDAELLAAVRALESFLATRAAEGGNGQAAVGESVN